MVIWLPLFAVGLALIGFLLLAMDRYHQRKHAHR